MRHINIVLASIVLITLLGACELNLLPKTTYYQENIEEEDPVIPYTTRSDMESLRNSIYGDGWLGTISFVGTLYYQVVTECRLDNAYNGTTHAKLRDIESNNISSTNEDVTVTWTRYFQQINNANNIICYIDEIFKKDDAWNDESEKNRWKAEALIYRSWLWMQATSLWGSIPLNLEIPASITADNVEEVYPLYYPESQPIETVYQQIIDDLNFACQWAPDTDMSDKGTYSKAFAHGLLARLYAQNTSMRDWQKVDEHCKAVEKEGYTLSESYDNIWGFDPAGDAFRNNPETIFELQSNKSHGDRLCYMYYYNQYSNKESFTWAKYLTPSRNLIAAFDAENDKERKNASMKFDQCGWSLYYPSDNYPFAYKVRTNASSIIFMRLAEIYLLHAEALAAQGDLKGAIGYVNKIRERVHLDDIAVPANYDATVDVILHERRLELAFEGFRFFDVARYGWEKVKAIHDVMPIEDTYWQPRKPFTENDLLLPIPQNELDKNPNLKQNPGY